MPSPDSMRAESDAGGCGCATPDSTGASTCYCTVDDLVHAISRKYSLSIVNLLGDRGSCRFRDIDNALPQVGPSTLSDTLKELVEVGLLRRRVFPDTPPRVEYDLTDAGGLLRDRFHHLLDEVRES